MNVRAPSCISAIEEIKHWAAARQLDVCEDLLTGSGAVYSPCRRYRLFIWRIWNPGGQFMSFGMLNPSTAGHDSTDPTATRCTKRGINTYDWTVGGWIGWNLFDYRATEPRVMKRQLHPISDDNDDAIRMALSLARQHIAGWGVDGDFKGRDQQVLKIVAVEEATLYCLGLTKHGFPRHPLYVPFIQKPQPWEFDH